MCNALQWHDTTRHDLLPTRRWLPHGIVTDFFVTTETSPRLSNKLIITSRDLQLLAAVWNFHHASLQTTMMNWRWYTVTIVIAASQVSVMIPYQYGGRRTFSLGVQLSEKKASLRGLFLPTVTELVTIRIW